MPGANEPFGFITVQWTVNPQPGNTFVDNEFNAQVGMWTLVQLPPGNTLVAARIKTAQVVDAGLPTSQAIFTGEVASLGATGPRSDVTIIPNP